MELVAPVTAVIFFCSTCTVLGFASFLVRALYHSIG